MTKIKQEDLDDNDPIMTECRRVRREIQSHFKTMEEYLAYIRELDRKHLARKAKESGKLPARVPSPRKKSGAA